MSVVGSLQMRTGVCARPPRSAACTTALNPSSPPTFWVSISICPTSSKEKLLFHTRKRKTEHGSIPETTANHLFHRPQRRSHPAYGPAPAHQRPAKCATRRADLRGLSSFGDQAERGDKPGVDD